jgi:hypothetical protein
MNFSKNLASDESKMTGDPIMDEAVKLGGTITQLSEPIKRQLRIYWNS